jgi:hypothetical protein
MRRTGSSATRQTTRGSAATERPAVAHTSRTHRTEASRHLAVRDGAALGSRDSRRRQPDSHGRPLRRVFWRTNEARDARGLPPLALWPGADQLTAANDDLAEIGDAHSIREEDFAHYASLVVATTPTSGDRYHGARMRTALSVDVSDPGPQRPADDPEPPATDDEPINTHAGSEGASTSPNGPTSSPTAGQSSTPSLPSATADLARRCSS